MRRLIEAVAMDSKHPWCDKTRNQFAIDANAILEALLLEYGVEAALDALVKQGFFAERRVSLCSRAIARKGS